MIYLLLAIVGSGVIPVIFRAFEAWRVNLYWAIPVNYLTCVVLGNAFGGGLIDPLGLMHRPWAVFAAVQGILLAVNFYLLAYTAQRAGVAIAALASRLSVAVPTLLAFVLYGDALTSLKLAGLLAALTALYLCTAPERAGGAKANLSRLMPVLVFATFGAYFAILKYLQARYLDAASYHSYVMAGFLFAFLASLLIGAVKGLVSPAQLRGRPIAAGLALGGVNYLAVYALLRMLALEGWESSQLFPTYSVGVVALSALLGALLFGERLSRRRKLGLALGALAVALLNR